MSAIDDFAIPVSRPRPRPLRLSAPLILAVAVATGLALQALDHATGTDDPTSAGPYTQVQEWRGNSGSLPPLAD